jgi:hypothetical protein
LTENSVQAAPAGLTSSTFAAVTAGANNLATLGLVKATLKAIFYAKIKTAVLIACAVIAVAGSGTVVLQNVFTPKDFSKSDSVSIRLGQRESGNGITHLDKVPDGQTAIVTIDGSRGRYLKLIGNRTTLYFYFSIDPRFKQRDVSAVRIDVEYFDPSGGVLGVHYDPQVRSARLDPAYKEANWPVVLSGSQRWRTATFRIRDAGFKNSQNAAADFRIWAKTQEIYIRRVTVTRESVQSAANVRAVPLGTTLSLFPQSRD